MGPRPFNRFYFPCHSGKYIIPKLTDSGCLLTVISKEGPDPHRAAARRSGHLEAQRRRLGLDARSQTGEK
jgi:hypothetical protein